MPAGGSCCKRLKSRINLLRDGVDMAPVSPSPPGAPLCATPLHFDTEGIGMWRWRCKQDRSCAKTREREADETLEPRGAWVALVRVGLGVCLSGCCRPFLPHSLVSDSLALQTSCPLLFRPIRWTAAIYRRHPRPRSLHPLFRHHSSSTREACGLFTLCGCVQTQPHAIPPRHSRFQVLLESELDERNRSSPRSRSLAAAAAEEASGPATLELDSPFSSLTILTPPRSRFSAKLSPYLESFFMVSHSSALTTTASCDTMRKGRLLPALDPMAPHPCRPLSPLDPPPTAYNPLPSMKSFPQKLLSPTSLLSFSSILQIDTSPVFTTDHSTARHPQKSISNANQIKSLTNPFHDAATILNPLPTQLNHHKNSFLHLVHLLLSQPNSTMAIDIVRHDLANSHKTNRTDGMRKEPNSNKTKCVSSLTSNPLPSITGSPRQCHQRTSHAHSTPWVHPALASRNFPVCDGKRLPVPDAHRHRVLAPCVQIPLGLTACLKLAFP